MSLYDAPSLSSGLLRLLTAPLRVLKDIIDVETGGDVIAAKVIVLKRRLEKIRSGNLPEDRWQQLARKGDEWQKALEEFGKIVTEADEVSKKIKKYKGRRRMWFFAKRLKNRLTEADQELTSVISVLFGEDEQSWAQELMGQLREIRWIGCSVDPVVSPEEDAEQLARLSLTQDPLSPLEDCIRYNNRKLEFLEQQMAPLQRLAGRLPPADCPPQHWTDSMQHLEETLKSATKFISSHRCRFNIQTFYTTYYAKTKIEKICEILKSISVEWKPFVEELRDEQVLDTVPQDAVLADRDDLQMKLSFVLKGDACDFPLALRAEWEGVKSEHKRRVNKLSIINEHEIKWHDLIAGDNTEGTYKVLYYGDKATAKQMTQNGAELELEDFAKFFTEAAIIESMSIRWVAPLMGISMQGVMVVEGGDKDLMQWYMDLQEADWGEKVRVMWEAAQGLKYVHDLEVIHRCISSHSYIVFPGDSIKLTNFSFATEITEVKTLSHRWQAALPCWIAPETYIGSPHSKSSDVYSFGVVMHEVAAMCQPYGLNPTHVQLLGMKQKGTLPCAIPGDCPQALMDLMAECCSARMGARPTMVDVVDRLSDIRTMLAEAL